MDRMDLRSVLLEIHTALSEASIAHALIGGLALAAHGAGRHQRPRPARRRRALWRRGPNLAPARRRHPQHPRRVDPLRGCVRSDRPRGPVVVERPGAAYQDLEDIDRLLRRAPVDHARVREYFRMFDRENELDALLAGRPGR